MRGASAVDECRRLGLDPGQRSRFLARLTSLCETGAIPSAAVVWGRRRGATEPVIVGRMADSPSAPPARDDTLFLVASLTKPVVAMAIVILIERGELTLDDRVADLLPGFNDGRPFKTDVRLRHLLTHTSGLPDMTPSNRALRERHAPLEQFIEEIQGLPLAFPPGRGVSYQSTGFALLGEVVRTVTGQTLPAFLHQAIFEPLGMNDTSLGWRPEAASRIAANRLEPEMQGTQWHWNTPYWLGFGAPWGGLITSPADFACFCRLMLNEGSLDGVRIVSPAGVRMATRNQLEGFPALPETDRRLRPWGLGWRLAWPGTSAHFGDALGPRGFGHWGATGTLCWIDPERDEVLVIFTTLPGGEEGSHLARLTNGATAVFTSDTTA
ncbi:MAG: serine hydrolase domain-containing protein [Isosphaeraceae bacterium]